MSDAHKHDKSCYSSIPETEGPGEYLSCGKIAGEVSDPVKAQGAKAETVGERLRVALTEALHETYLGESVGTKTTSRCVDAILPIFEQELADRDRTIAALQKALDRVNDVRNSIIGYQGFNFSMHAYPLVAALEAAGIEGLGYDKARPQLLEINLKISKWNDVANSERALLESTKPAMTGEGAKHG